MYMGTFPAFLSAWGPIDFSFGSGQGVKCVHSEHLYGEFWHRAFTVAADTPSSRYVISLGANVESSGGPCAVTRHAEARMRGYKRVQVEPHLSVTGACSAEWVPIRPKTDPAFMFALIHVLLIEHKLDELDVPFLRDSTSSPYLVGPDGLYLRDAGDRKPLLWDRCRGKRRPLRYHRCCAGPVGEIHRQRGGQRRRRRRSGRDMGNVEGVTAFTKLVEHIEKYSPEWAATVCDVPAATIRRIANEYLEAASVGATTVIDGVTLPLRPVAVILGKSVNNGWGAYECCWARTVLAVLVGALENPGGTLGTTVRLNRPHDNRHKSVLPGEDGFMAQKFNPTDKANWAAKPTGRNMHKTLVPIVGNTAWSQALGPTQLAWMFQREQPAGSTCRKPTLPDVWFIYRTNPAISFWDTQTLVKTHRHLPLHGRIRLHGGRDQLHGRRAAAGATDLESAQMIRVGGTKFMEQFWDHKGVAYASLPWRRRAIRATSPGSPRNWPSAWACSSSTTTRSIAARRAFAAQGRNYDFSLDPKVEHDAPDSSGIRSAGPQRHRCPKARRPTTWTGSRSTASTRCRCRA
jgi:phenylacetyl-CoA:acceptor oxidoreductase